MPYQKLDLNKTQGTTAIIQLKNYNIEHVPTESANGGVLLYMKKAINYKLRQDFMIFKKGNWSQFLLK